MTELAALEARIRRLEDLEAIRNVKHRYFRCLDSQQWDELRSCFTDDVVTDYEDGHYHLEGIDEAMRFLTESLGGLRAMGRVAKHTGLHPEIELTSDTTATGHWTLHAFAFDARRRELSTQVSYYEDRYRKTGGEWRITYTGYTSYIHSTAEAVAMHVEVDSENDSRAFNHKARGTAR